MIDQNVDFLKATTTKIHQFSNNVFKFIPCISFAVISVVECGVSGRYPNNNPSGIPNRSLYTATGPSQYNNNYNVAKNQMPPQPLSSNRNGYYNQVEYNQPLTNKTMPRPGFGLSAWGLITIIMLVIIIGMGGYYGIICYPLICKDERNYDIMDAASTTASANTCTPTRSSDFEKSGNYSSRSTTPSVIINT